MNEDSIETNKGLTEVVLSEVKGEHLQDLGAEALELGLDSLLQDGLLKDIPVVGSLVSLVKFGKGVKDALFTKKLLAFLYALKDIPLKERIQMIDELNASEAYRGRVGERLVVVLDRLDDLDKAQVIGKLFGATIEKKISFEQFLRLSMIVDRGFLPDLKRLMAHPALIRLSDETKEHFANIGIMSTSVKGNGQSRTWDGANEPPPEIEYKLNGLGYMLAKHGFDAPGVN